MDTELKKKILSDIYESHAAVEAQFKTLHEQIHVTEDLINQITAAISSMRFQIPAVGTEKGVNLFGVKMALIDTNQHLRETLAMANHDIIRMQEIVNTVKASSNQDGD